MNRIGDANCRVASDDVLRKEKRDSSAIESEDVIEV